MRTRIRIGARIFLRCDRLVMRCHRLMSEVAPADATAGGWHVRGTSPLPPSDLQPSHGHSHGMAPVLQASHMSASGDSTTFWQNMTVSVEPQPAQAHGSPTKVIGPSRSTVHGTVPPSPKSEGSTSGSADARKKAIGPPRSTVHGAVPPSPKGEGSTGGSADARTAMTWSYRWRA